MQILLSPKTARSLGLRQVYARAFRDAVELLIASAYLTDWTSVPKLTSTCRRLLFIVGTDFGLTRKKAMYEVMKWLPKEGACQFLAAPKMIGGGFHPKLVAWRTRAGKHFIVIGSSNLSKAAFNTNYEANIKLEISKAQFASIGNWIEPIAAQSVPVTSDWVSNHYREAPISQTKGGQATPGPAVHLQLPEGPAYRQVVKERRKQQGEFAEIGRKLLTEARRCASGTVTDGAFWSRFWELWSNHPSRFQGSGLQFSGKTARWRQACGALVKIIDTAKSGQPQSAVDAVVASEIDELRKLRNPARCAWLSEMLCHYFPNEYPVQNAPVKLWLKRNRWSGRRGTTEGQKYVELAKQLRFAVRNKPAGARNLAELDLAIWLWSSKRR